MISLILAVIKQSIMRKKSPKLLSILIRFLLLLIMMSSSMKINVKILKQWKKKTWDFRFGLDGRKLLRLEGEVAPGIYLNGWS
jgi:hypothetical protein